MLVLSSRPSSYKQWSLQLQICSSPRPSSQLSSPRAISCVLKMYLDGKTKHLLLGDLITADHNLHCKHTADWNDPRMMRRPAGNDNNTILIQSFTPVPKDQPLHHQTQQIPWTLYSRAKRNYGSRGRSVNYAMITIVLRSSKSIASIHLNNNNEYLNTTAAATIRQQIITIIGYSYKRVKLGRVNYFNEDISP